MMKKNGHSREFPCRESNPGYGGENARSQPLDHMGVSQAFSIFLLFWEKISKDSLEFIKKEVSTVQSDLIVSKNVVMKDILKYSHKYLTFEVIQGIKIFQILSACVSGESNPGLPGGRREFYH